MLKLPGVSPDQAVQAAREALEQGKLIVAPTDTVYGIAGRADDPDAVAALRQLAGSASGHLTWHAPSRQQALEGLTLKGPAHQRLLNRFLPGPVRFVIEQSEDTLAALCSRLGVRRSVIDDGAALRLRVPADPIITAILKRTAHPVVMIRASAAGFGAGPGGRDDQRVGDVTDPRVGCVIDTGPTTLGKPASTVRLKRDGGFELVDQGAVSSEEIMAAVERVILFVCTGNTCRSPMAEGIAKSMLGPEDLTTVISAGVASVDGMPISQEAIDALKPDGIDISSCRTRQLTPSLIKRAAAIYVMTDSHLQRVLELEPSARDRVHKLDPAGDIPDPVGMPLEAYRQTASKMRELIAQRLKELKE